jgi:hypothetical protein
MFGPDGCELLICIMSIRDAQRTNRWSSCLNKQELRVILRRDRLSRSGEVAEGPQLDQLLLARGRCTSSSPVRGPSCDPVRPRSGRRPSCDLQRALDLPDARLRDPQRTRRHDIVVRHDGRLAAAREQIRPSLDQRPRHAAIATLRRRRDFPAQNVLDLLAGELHAVPPIPRSLRHRVHSPPPRLRARPS